AWKRANLGISGRIACAYRLRDVERRLRGIGSLTQSSECDHIRRPQEIASVHLCRRAVLKASKQGHYDCVLCHCNAPGKVGCASPPRTCATKDGAFPISLCRPSAPHALVRPIDVEQSRLT